MSHPRKLYHAHPAFTLREMHPGDPLTLQPEGLGFRWLRHGRAERQRQATVFFSTLLDDIAQTPGALILVEFPTLDAADAFAAAWKLQPAGYEVMGNCTPEIVSELQHVSFDHVQIRTPEGRTMLEMDTPWEGVGVWLDDEEAEACRRRLREVVALNRDVGRAGRDRPLRAGVYVAAANAFWIVASVIGLAAMWGLNQLGVSLLIAAPLGFAVIAGLILGPPGTVARRGLRRLI